MVLHKAITEQSYLTTEEGYFPFLGTVNIIAQFELFYINVLNQIHLKLGI